MKRREENDIIPKVVFVLMLALKGDPARAPGIVLAYASEAECLAAVAVKTEAFAGSSKYFDAFCVAYSVVLGADGQPKLLPTN